jgi:putative ABC transport system permease protein
MSARRRNAPARRAVVRWALRLLQREWRQHLLVITLITVTVAAALFGATTAYNAVPSHDGRFGHATHRFDLSVDGPEQIDEFVADAESWFGNVEVIGRRHLPVPGSTEEVEVRSQDPTGPIGAPMVALTDGRYPTTAGEVAVTDGTAHLLDVAVGDAVDLADERLTVVGAIENPDALDDEFALVPPLAGGTPQSARILLRADDERVHEFHSPAAPSRWSIEPRGSTEKTMAAIGVLVAATVAMLLVALVAAAAFVVIAQRRQRQLGLLAAAGATERHVRAVMVAGGAAVGVVSAVAGALLAFAAWVAVAPALEQAVGRRLGRFDIPWWAVAGGLALAVATSVAAAWWPARTIARQPIMSALSGRPHPPRRARRSAVAALALLAGGVTSLAFAIDPSEDTGNVPLTLAGVVATTLGLVLAAAPTVRLAGALARRTPLASRLALRDLARYQSRSGAALAAISLGLAIATAVVVIAAANEASADQGNLSSRQALAHLGDPSDGPALSLPEVAPAELDAMQASVQAWAATLDDARVVPLDAAVDPTLTERLDGRVHHPTAVLGIPINENTTRDAGLIYVATPALLDYLSIDATTIDAETTMLTSQAGEVEFTGNISREAGPLPDPIVQRIPASLYSSVPDSLITELGVETGNWAPWPAGWLVESSSPLTDAELSAAREMAASSGLIIEARDPQSGLSTLRTAATGAGVVLALAILAMTVGLIRAEAAGDVRTLTAVGASSQTRRAVTASTAAALAVLAVILGMTTAYAAVYAGYTPATDRLDNIPVTNLLAIAVGFPLIAGAAGWMLSRREPPGLIRPSIE